MIDLILASRSNPGTLLGQTSLLLEIPSITTHPTLGDHAFQSAAPYMNALPATNCNITTLDTFKIAVTTDFLDLTLK